jgi:hypothetical protein
MHCHPSHGLRSDRLREDAYFAEVDRILMENLREVMELQREAEACAAAGQTEQTSRSPIAEKELVSSDSL